MTGLREANAAARTLCSALVALCLMLLLTAAPAIAAESLRGVALVIGNSDYASLPKLANPGKDADAVEAMLAELGFDSVRRSDRNASSLKRDLERFVEDAADADVAVLYYAGHGIEAGGENFLVPVDADIAALDDAREKLVPLSAILAELRAAVPIAIVLLDACRDNPFPPGATAKLSPDGAPAPVSAGGLAETRGARALEPGKPADENLGMVIGFAAEPGKPALDGDAGGHSPYAAALLRHLDAMAGEEFGTVMRMVAEEVYLKTGGRQRPWTNESLRRLLYFGEAPEAAQGADGEILKERRRLLLTVAALPLPQRAGAEKLARDDGVPISVVFAMMKAAGIDANADPATAEKRLRAEIARFAESRRARAALTDPDPEIERLTGLADRAETEGALAAADGFREQAKKRVTALRSTRQDQIAALRQRIVEDAEVFARSAETKKLLFRHDEAARDLAEARAIVADWDAQKAAAYREEEVAAWLIHAEIKGSDEALAAAERLSRESLRQTGRSTAQATATQRELALALMLRANRSGDPAPLAEAARLLDSAIAAGRTLAPAERARLAVEAGRAVGSEALMRNRPAGLERAETRFTEAIALAEEAGDEAIEAEARFRLVQALYFRWTAEPGQALWDRMRDQFLGFAAMMEGEDDADELAVRYLAQTTPIALDMALRQNTPDALRLASEINGAVGELFDPDRFPLIRATLRGNEGRIALEWSDRFGDPSQLEGGLAALRDALAVFEGAGARSMASETRWTMALVEAAIGQRSGSTEPMQQALALLRALASDPAVAANPIQRKSLGFHEARIAAVLAARQGEDEALEQAAGRLRAIHDAAGGPGDALQRVAAEAELGKALAALAGLRDDESLLAESVALLRQAIATYRSWGADAANAGPFAELFNQYATAAAGLALADTRTETLAEAIEAGRENHARMTAFGHVQGIALTANTLAYLLVTESHIAYDSGRMAEAEARAAEAMAASTAMPGMAAHADNTGCAVRAQRARHERSAALARAAAELCSTAATKLEAYGDIATAETARRSGAEMTALAGALPDR